MTELGIAAIDHILTYVPCLETAADQFERMGFRLSPISKIDNMGISNRMILMHPCGPERANFIELMSPHDPGQLPESMRTMLSGQAGSRSIVLASNNINSLFKRITDNGFPASPPVHVKREWKIANEPSVFPEFNVILPFESAFTFNACQYFNAHLYTRPDWLNHPNTAIRLKTIFAVSDSLESSLFFEDILGYSKRYLSPDEIMYDSAEVDLLVMSSSAARNRFSLDLSATLQKYVGYEVSVKSLQQLKNCLSSGQIPWSQIDDAVIVAPEHGLGNIILFKEQS